MEAPRLADRIELVGCCFDERNDEEVFVGRPGSPRGGIALLLPATALPEVGAEARIPNACLRFDFSVMALFSPGLAIFDLSCDLWCSQYAPFLLSLIMLQGLPPAFVAVLLVTPAQRQ
jgi:hypothetical protein